jgi:hypothetical protein
MKNGRFLIVVLTFSFALIFAPKLTEACGHDGFFIGGGYQQMFMYTPEDQLTGGGGIVSQQIKFGPGFGMHLLLGYDFEGSRWGIQAPLGYSYIRLNEAEWVHYFDIDVEGILHLAYWENGVDLYLVGGAGGSFLTEGSVSNNSRASGINVGIGPGFSYFFARGKNKGSLYIQVPVRMVHFFGNNLSSNGTTLLQVPIRLGISVGF